MIILFKFGDIKEIVVMVKYVKENGIRVIFLIKELNFFLVLNFNYVILMRYENGVEYEYMLLFWLFFRLMENNGDFFEYEKFVE